MKPDQLISQRFTDLVNLYDMLISEGEDPSSLSNIIL